MINGEGGRIAEEIRVDYVVDRVDTTAHVWLGLTVGCARCHDHKYDPITQKEYYQLFAYFNRSPRSAAAIAATAPPLRPSSCRREEQKKKIAELKQKNRRAGKATQGGRADKSAAGQEAWEKKLDVAKLPNNAAGALKVESARAQRQSKTEARPSIIWTGCPKPRSCNRTSSETRKTLADVEKTVVITHGHGRAPKPRDTFVLDARRLQQVRRKVTASVPEAFPPLPKDAPNNRLGFAKWLVDQSNPLTAA